MRGVIVNAKRFREFRQSRQLTQQELSTQAGVGVRTVRNAEKGHRVRLEFIEYMAAVLEVDVCDIVDDRDEMQLALREKRRGERIVEAIAAHARGDRAEYFKLFAREIRVIVPGPSEIPFAGDHVGIDQIHRYFDRSLETIGYDGVPEILEIRTGGNLVVMRGVDKLTALPTGKSFTAPWIHVYEFDKGRIVRVDNWGDIATVRDAFVPDPPKYVRGTNLAE